jgi:hypothetical protein
VPTNRLPAFLVFILTTIFYIFTLLPSLAWGDGTKLQSEAISGESFVLAEMTPGEFSPDPFIFAKVGVAAWDHPLYIVLGHLLVQALPLVDPLWLVNLISALFGAASIALVFQLCFRFTKSILASWYAAFSLAASHTFWWHSSTPEVYTLFVFLLLVSLHLFDSYERTRKYSFLLGSAFSLGLAASDHLLAFLAIPALGLYYLLSKGYQSFHIFQLRNLIFPSLGFLAGSILYIIQFARMAANFPLNEILGPVVGSTFLSQLVMLTPILLGQSLLNYLFLLTLQFSPAGVVLGVLGFRKILQNRDLYLRKMIALFVVFTSFGILYRVSDQFAFFITSYVFWAIMMGIGLDHIFSTFSGTLRPVLAGILALMILGAPFFYEALPGIAKKAGMTDTSIGIPQIGIGVRDGLTYYINPNKRGDYHAYDFGSQTVTNLAPNSVVIAEWYTDTDEYFALRYFTKVKKVRSDVIVVGWPTQDPFGFDPQLALKKVEDSFPDSPVYLASLSDRFYSASKLVAMYCIVPENNLYRLYQKPNNSLQCLENDSITE